MPHLLYQRKEHLLDDLVIKLVLAVKADEVVSQVILLEHSLGIGHGRVMKTDESPAGLSLCCRDALELLTLHLIVMGDDVFGYLECLGAIIATAVELVFSRLQPF